jgi:hypothetical protein
MKLRHDLEYGREEEPIYRAECDRCGAWETTDSLRRARNWAVEHIVDADYHDDDDRANGVYVAIWRAIGNVA